MLVEVGAKHSKIRTSIGRSTQTLLMPGTMLIREWEEREHRVTVTPDGLHELNGQVFKSLSAAARRVTLFDLAVDPPARWDDQRARLRR